VSDEPDPTEGQEGPDPAELFAGALMALTSEAVELSTLKLANMARKAADVGVSTASCACLMDPTGESKNKAFVFLLSGEIPDDIIEGLDQYCRATVQDYTNGNKALKIMKEYDSEKDQ
jgi:hypothetical protein